MRQSRIKSRRGLATNAIQKEIDRDIIDTGFGTKEWYEEWEQRRREESFSKLISYLQDIQLLAAERDLFSVNQLVSAALVTAHAIGIENNINGQRRIGHVT